MTTKEFRVIGKQVFTDNPQFTMTGRLAVQRPMNQVLRGVLFESSSFSKDAFYCNFFVWPLCVPTQHMVLDFGNRLQTAGKGDRWTNNADYMDDLRNAVNTQAIPFLSQFQTLEAFIANAGVSQNILYRDRSVAYALMKLERNEEAIERVECALDSLGNTYAWQHDMHRELEDLRTRLLSNDPSNQQWLESIERETISNLKLTSVMD